MASAQAADIIAAVQRQWLPFRALAGELGARLAETTPAGWTAKEMLGTVAFWDEAAFAWITIGLREQALPQGWAFASGFDHASGWPSADVHNAREAAWARDRTVAEVLDRCDSAHAQLLAILDTVTGDEAAKHADYFKELGGHYADHMPELRVLQHGGVAR